MLIYFKCLFAFEGVYLYSTNESSVRFDNNCYYNYHTNINI